MSLSEFVVDVADLRRGPIRVRWDVSLAWLHAALAGTEASPTTPGALSLEVALNGLEVMVRGQADVQVAMPCSRTMEPVPVALSPEIFLLLAPARTPEPRGRQEHGRRSRSRGASRSAGQKEQRAGSTPRGGWSEDPTLAGSLAAHDTYQGERIVLDPFVREFLLLDLPMSVLRSDLRSDEDAAIGPPSGSDGTPSATDTPLDPRLAPLAAIASRLRGENDKE